MAPVFPCYASENSIRARWLSWPSIPSSTPYPCLAAHERLSYSTDYPITQNWWTITNGNCSRAAELILANHEPTHVPPNVTTGSTQISLPGLPAKTGLWRIDPVVCKNTISTVPPHMITP